MALGVGLNKATDPGFFGFDLDELEAVVALYDGAIRYVDSVVGRAIERWEEGLLVLFRLTRMSPSDYPEV